MMETQDLRIRGIYEQAQPGKYMLRIKVPGGALSANAAQKVAETADKYAGARMHLTTRMSVELHDLTAEDLEPVLSALAGVGLTSRGACGGAVRGIAASTPLLPDGARAAALARAINDHFTGNPEFEGLPKKFKIGVDVSHEGGRYLIQDAGLVLAGFDGGGSTYDLWLAGGLGREPKGAFLYRKAVPEAAVIPLLEAVVKVYGDNTPKGRRLKHLVADKGREWVCEEINKNAAPEAVQGDGGKPPESPATAESATADFLVVPIFAGEVTSQMLTRLADIALSHSDGSLFLTPEQDIALSLKTNSDSTPVREELIAAGFELDGPEVTAVFRVCPGSHECKMGLAPTREVARRLLAVAGERAASVSWAISGCPNSCSQPQLADIGIVSRKLSKNEDGTRTPRYQLWSRKGDGLGEIVKENLSEEELLVEIENQLPS